MTCLLQDKQGKRLSDVGNGSVGVRVGPSVCVRVLLCMCVFRSGGTLSQRR